MRIIRYLARSINSLNILLFITMVAAIIYILLPLMKMNARYSLPHAKQKTVEEAEKPQEKNVSILPADYTAIGELNLFHPERRIPVEKKADEIPKPELILYGTMVQDNIQYAFIEDKKNPKTTPGRGSRQTVIKKGEIIGGFVVSDIRADRITLTKGDETMTVLLTSSDKRIGTAGTASTQRPIQTTNPVTTPAQGAPGSPFAPAPGTSAGPMQQMGGRPVGGPPATQPPGTTPQPLPRGGLPGRGGPGTIPTR